MPAIGIRTRLTSNDTSFDKAARAEAKAVVDRWNEQ
jgi:hypothetical protein